MNQVKEEKFWERLRERCLIPESAVFSSVAELKHRLEDLRNSSLTILFVTNAIWMILLITLDRQVRTNFY